MTLFKQSSLHPKSTGKYFRIQDDHPTALPLNANLTELCMPAQWRAALWEGECRNEMREGPLRWNKNRLPWSYHGMAQTFSLWGKKMLLTAVIVFITFSSSFFVVFFFPPVQLCFLKNALYKRRDTWQPGSAALWNYFGNGPVCRLH